MNQSTFERRISTQLTTWLRAVGIGFEDTTSGLVVTNKKGERVPVDLGFQARANAISVHGPDLTHRDLGKSLKAFQALQEALGYDPRTPVDRGPIPTHKANSAEDFDAVAMRHSEFRRVPNPPAAKLRGYSDVIGKTSWKFYRWNTQACQDHGLDIDDLKSYASVWTCNYIGMYEIATNPEGENKRFLSNYLQQRFQEFRKQLDKRSRNTLPTLDEAFIAQHGRPYEYTQKSDWLAGDPTDPVSEWNVADDGEEGEVEGRSEGVRGRRKRHSTELHDRLAGMPHDDMVAALSMAIESDRIHMDARRAASKHLQAHAKKCQDCFSKELPRVEGDDSAPGNVPIEDEAGNVYPTIKDAAQALGLFPSNIRAVLSGRYGHSGGHSFKYAPPQTST